MNVLLVYPEFAETFWSYSHALRFIGRRAVQPPLGLLTVAAMLPGSWETRLVDMNVRTLRRIDLKWADCVFLSAMGVQQASAKRVIALCREVGVRVVAGGPLFTATPEAFPEVDHLVLSEAELTLPPFLKDLEAGRAARVYRTSEFADLSKSPMPRFELAELGRYAIMPVQYSRGCPFDCEFCDVTALFGHRPRLKSAEQIIAELDRLKTLRWRGQVFFVDDNLIGNKRHLKEELLPALTAWQHEHGPTAFNSQVSINLADDPALIDGLVRAGFNTVFIGIETPDAATLASCNKKQNVQRDLLADVRRIQAAGIQVQGGFIVGFDSDKPGVFQRQIDFIQASGISTAMVGLLQALAGTRLHARLQRENRLRGESSGNNVATFTNFVPIMDEDELRQGYSLVLRTIYSPRGYYQRIKTFLRAYGQPRVKQRLAWRDIRAFFLANFSLGVVGRERVQYWRLMIWTLLHRPRSLPVAVYLAILGNHYRRICQKYIRGATASPAQ